MEFLTGIGLLGGLFMLLLLMLKVGFWALLFVAFPIFWVWMLIDAILRRDEEYPSGGRNEKILWIVLMIVLQVAAVAYWFLVYRVARRQSAGTTAPSVPAPPAPPVQPASELLAPSVVAPPAPAVPPAPGA